MKIYKLIFFNILFFALVSCSFNSQSRKLDFEFSQEIDFVNKIISTPDSVNIIIINSEFYNYNITLINVKYNDLIDYLQYNNCKSSIISRGFTRAAYKPKVYLENAKVIAVKNKCNLSYHSLVFTFSKMNNKYILYCVDLILN